MISERNTPFKKTRKWGNPQWRAFKLPDEQIQIFVLSISGYCSRRHISGTQSPWTYARGFYRTWVKKKNRAKKNTECSYASFTHTLEPSYRTQLWPPTFSLRCWFEYIFHTFFAIDVLKVVSHEPSQLAMRWITTLQTLIWSKKGLWKSVKCHDCVFIGKNCNPMKHCECHNWIDGNV